MAITITELELESASVLPARQTMRRGGAGAFNNNLNTVSGNIFVVANNHATANVYCGFDNSNTAAASQSIVVAPMTSGGITLGLPIN